MKDSNFSDPEAFKRYVLSLMPSPPIDYAVSREQQENEILSLSNTIGSRRFFFVINFERFEIEHQHGIHRWLGYVDNQFTLRNYHDILHPSKKKTAKIIAVNFINTYAKGIYPLSFMVQRYSTLVALRHYKGNYLLVNKITSVFQFDKTNHLTGCMHEFTIIKDFEGEALTPSFFMSNGDEDERGREIMEKTKEQFERLKVFSPKEMQVARKLAYQPGTTMNEMAEALAISVPALHQYYNRFLKKAREFFEINFVTTLEAALYVKKEGLL
jgi:hypothetical protein